MVNHRKMIKLIKKYAVKYSEQYSREYAIQYSHPGPTGAIGPTGVTGPTGPTGVTGSSGSSVVSVGGGAPPISPEFYGYYLINYGDFGINGITFDQNNTIYMSLQYSSTIGIYAEPVKQTTNTPLGITGPHHPIGKLGTTSFITVLYNQNGVEAADLFYKSGILWVNAFSPTGTQGYVYGLSGNNIEYGPIQVGLDPIQIFVDNNYEWVLCGQIPEQNYNGTLYQLGPTSVLNAYTCGVNPQSFIYDNNHNIWIVNKNSNNITVVLKSGLIKTIATGNSPVDIAYNNGNVYVICSSESTATLYMYRVDSSANILSSTTVNFNDGLSKIAIDGNGYLWISGTNIIGNNLNLYYLTPSEPEPKSVPLLYSPAVTITTQNIVPPEFLYYLNGTINAVYIFLDAYIQTVYGVGSY